MSEPVTSVSGESVRARQEPSSADCDPSAAPSPLGGLTADNAAERRVRIEQEFRDVQRVCFFYAAMLLPVLAGTAWKFHTESTRMEIEFWKAGMLYGIIAAFAIAWRSDWTSLVRWPPELSRHLIFLLVATPLCSVTAAHLLCTWGKAVGLPIIDLLEGFGEGGYPLWLLFVWTAVLPPLFEEIAFRGLLFGKLQRLMKPTHAVWVSALLFGLIHFSVLSMAMFLVPLAVVAGYVVRRTGSLVPAFWLHAAHNTGVLVLALIAEKST